MIRPGSTIGIVGGGQLGRMFALAAAEMGYHTHVFCPEENSPAKQVAALATTAPYDDIAALRRFAESVDVITFEFENIPAESLAAITGIAPIRPNPRLLALTQNRLREKTFANELSIPTAPFRRIGSEMELVEALATDLPPPCILKTTELGYDGKGQVKIMHPHEAAQAWMVLKTHEAILEGFVDFAFEVSVIVARNPKGDITCFPLVENVHRHHILHQTIAPARVEPAIAMQAETIARKIAEATKLEGLLAIEMFVGKDGSLLINELAPRPHNSGHWTMDACATSQFEQHVRAVCNLPLGATDILCPAVMTNLVGDEVDEWKTHLTDPHTKLHLYGKTEARQGRKMGHVTFLTLKTI